MLHKRPSDTDSTQPLIAYHGTTAACGGSIAAVGLQSFRKSEMVHLTHNRARAISYAAAWAVGTHAAGLYEWLRACLFKVQIEPGHTSVERGFDLALSAPLTRDHLVDVDLIDLNHVSPLERAGHLSNFLGILDWEFDPYTSRTEMFHELHRAVAHELESLPEELIAEGRRRVGAL